MGTKNKPGDYDCYANADPDEPMFVLLGRDDRAPALVEQWAAISEARGTEPAKVAEARTCAAAMRAWRAEDPNALRRTLFTEGGTAEGAPADTFAIRRGDESDAEVTLRLDGPHPFVEVLSSEEEDDGYNHPGAMFSDPNKLRLFAAALAEAADRLASANDRAKGAPR